MHRAALPWDFAAILLVLGVIVPWRGKVRVRELFARPQIDTYDRISIYGSTLAFQWLAATVTAWRWHEHGLSIALLGLELPRPARAFAVGIGLALVLAATQLLSLRQLSRIPPARRGFLQEMSSKLLPQSFLEALPFFALVCTVSLCEEFLYRGFALAVFEMLFDGSAVAGILCSAALFAVAHLYQGRRGMGGTFLLGMIFAVIRVWTGSLAPSVIAHLAVDSVAGVVAPRVLRRAPGEQLAT